jgi:hypothetical protein
MIRSPVQAFRSATVVAGVCAGLGAMVAAPAPAQAAVFVGVGVPFGGYGYGYGPPYGYSPYLPPPIYYPPPPVYYAPPPVYYTPPRPVNGSQTCYAGPYVCPMERPVASGAGCYCSGNYGQKVWGRAS